VSVPVSRRRFLHMSAASLAALLFRPPPGLAIGSAWPLPLRHRFFSDPHRLLTRAAEFDALLLPAYAAAELIRQDALQPLAGPAGRAHDPAGAFTMPHLTAAAVMIGRSASTSLDALWSPEAVWPADGRLVIGAALLRRGYPLNSIHPGQLAQVEKDLLALPLRLAAQPLRALEAGRGSLALALVPIDEMTRRRAAVPAEGRIEIEYDWVIPRAARQPEAAERFIRAQSALSDFNLAGRPSTFTLAPLPEAARARYAEIWDNVSRGAKRI
jgi:hypothetical protein